MLSADVTDEDLIAVAASARALGIDPVDVLKSTYFESAGFHPAAKNGAGCVGLNQFCSGTFEGAVPGLTKDAYAALPASAQLERYVTPFWLRVLGKRTLADAADLEWLNGWHATYRDGQTDDAVVTDKPADLAANPSFVHDGKSVITKGDLRRTLDEHATGPRFAELAARLAILSVQLPPPAPKPSPSLSGAELAALGLGAVVVGFAMGGGRA